MRRWNVFLLTFAALSAATASARPQYTVLAGDYSHIDGSTVEKGVKLAQEILEGAGVPVRLLVCPVVEFQGVLMANCPEMAQLPDAFVKVVAERNAGHTVRNGAMGVAMPDLNSTQPTSAFVFYDRVRQTAESFNCPPFMVLGHAMAHEIGHLLGCKHSKSGIMRPEWTKSIIAEISRDLLKFSAEQAEAMRANVERRAERRSAAGAGKSQTSCSTVKITHRCVSGAGSLWDREE